MKNMFLSVVFIVSCICTAGLGKFVESTEPDNGRRRARIEPSFAKIEPAGTKKFKVIMSPGYLKFATLAENVKFSVNGIPGGSKKLGTIDSNGLYHAPKEPLTRHEINICAEVPDAVNKYAFATIILGNPDKLYALEDSWSEPIADGSRLASPHGICVNTDGSLIIADRDKPRLLRYTTEGKFLGYVPAGAEQSGRLSEVRAVTIGPQGRIWACHQPTDETRINVYSPQGEFLHSFAHQGTGPGQILRPHGLEFGKKDRLYVVDVDNAKVNVYKKSGKFLFSWGKIGLETGEFNAPHGITVDPGGDVFVCNYYGPTCKFDDHGNLLFTFAYPDPPFGPVGFHSISSDRFGNIYYTIRTNEPSDLQKQGFKKTKPRLRIIKYNNNGDYITGWPLAEQQQGTDWIAVDDEGTVYVIFKSIGGGKNAGVQIYRPI